MSRKSAVSCFQLLLSAILLLSLSAACTPQVVQTAAPPTALPSSPAATPLPLSPTPLPTETQTPEGLPTAVNNPEAITPETAAQVGRQSKLGSGWGMLVGGPLYSPDGRWLAVSTAAGVFLFDAQTHAEAHALLHVLPTLAFSADGQILAAGGAEAIYLYRTEDGKLVHTLGVQQDRWYSAIAFSPDGSLVAGSDQGLTSTLVWSVDDGSPRYTLQGENPAFSPEGKLVVAINRDKQVVYLYNSEDGSLQNQWPGERAGFLPSGRLWIEHAGAVRVMDLQKDLVMAPFSGRLATFSADGNRLALFDQGKINVYEVPTSRRLSILEGNFSNVEVMQLSPDGQMLAAATSAPMCANCIDESLPLALWEVTDGKRIPNMDGMGRVHIFAFSPDGSTLAVAQAERLEFWRSGESSPADVLGGFYASVAGMAVSPDGTTLAVVNDSDPYTIRFWDLRRGMPLDQVQDQNGIGALSSVQVNYSPDGQTLTVGGDVWRQTEGGLWSKFELTSSETPTFWPSSNAISPDGGTLAEGYLEGSLLLWNLPGGSPQGKLSGPQGAVDYLAYSPDGKDLAAVYNSSPDSQVQVWQMPEGKEVMSLKGAHFARLAFSPDGGTLVTVAANQAIADVGPLAGFVQFWHIADRTLYLTLKADDTLSIAFSPDGRLLATGSIDGKVRLWQVEGGELLQTVELGQERIGHLAFTPDGSHLLCGGVDGVVYVLGLPK